LGRTHTIELRQKQFRDRSHWSPALEGGTEKKGKEHGQDLLSSEGIGGSRRQLRRSSCKGKFKNRRTGKLLKANAGRALGDKHDPWNHWSDGRGKAGTTEIEEVLEKKRNLKRRDPSTQGGCQKRIGLATRRGDRAIWMKKRKRDARVN